MVLSGGEGGLMSHRELHKKASTEPVTLYFQIIKQNTKKQNKEFRQL